MKSLKLRISALAIMMVIGAITMFVTSCSKDSQIIATSSQTGIKHNNLAMTAEGDIGDLTDAEIKLIGTEHNRLCKEIKALGAVNNYSNLYETINTVLENNNYQNLAKEEFVALWNSFNLTELDNTINSIVSEIDNDATKTIIIALNHALVNFESYDDLIIELNHLRSETNLELTGLNKTATLIAIEVAQNSARMWALTEMGGENYLDGTDGIIVDQPALAVNKAKVGRVVGADAVGAFTGFLRGASGYLFTGGPFNPVSNAYLAGHTILGAASSSVIAALP